MFNALVLAPFLFADFSYSPPTYQWIDFKDVDQGEWNGPLAYYDDVNHWVTTDFQTIYIPPPPAPPYPIYTHYHFSFSDSAVLSLVAGGNTVSVVVDRDNIVFVNGFEVGQGE